MPCYLKYICTEDHLSDSKERIKNYIKYRIKEYATTQGKKNTGIIAISVTERDRCYMNWLEVLSTFKGVGCTSTKTKWHEGGYMCYYITIPVAGNV